MLLDVVDDDGLKEHEERTQQVESIDSVYQAYEYVLTAVLVEIDIDLIRTVG